MNQSLTDPLILSETDIEGGGKEERNSVQNDFAYHNNVHNAAIKIRMGIFFKIYGKLLKLLFKYAYLMLYVCLQLLFEKCMDFSVCNYSWL